MRFWRDDGPGPEMNSARKLESAVETVRKRL